MPSSSPREAGGGTRHPLVNRAYVWHSYGMARIRVSTTVDEELLQDARKARTGVNDAALIDEALAALLARYRAAEIDASYKAYDDQPIEAPDEWGDLSSFHDAASSS
jgi:hypothetical protein